jgi:hypothetical protein
MKVRFISRVQRELYSRGVQGALDAWTVHTKTSCGKLVLVKSPPRTRRYCRNKLAHARTRSKASLTVPSELVVSVAFASCS